MLGALDAMIAGFFGALSSVAGKLMVSSASALRAFICGPVWIGANYDGSEGGRGLSVCDRDNALESIARVLSLGAVVASNMIMWTMYTRALKGSQTAAHATSVGNLSNIAFTGVLGRLFFHETLSANWMVGVSLICAGTVILHRRQAGSSDAC
eukprot:Partr_v1_DN25785_c0_g1_i1_m74850